MRRIEFIAPVESMRGNFGSRQDLVYAPNNNRAFESIEGQLNAALNYQPRMIGAKSKRNYFCVKSKSSNHLTPRAKSAMATLGGVGAVYSALVRNKTSNVYVNAYGCYQYAVAGGYTGTFRKYMFGFIQSALENKDATIDITTPNHHVSIKNPWVFGGTGIDVNVSIALVEKFFAQLNPNPIFFNLIVDEGQPITIRTKLFAQSGMTWKQYIEESGWNVYNFFIDPYEPGSKYIFGIYNEEGGPLCDVDNAWSNVYSDYLMKSGTYGLAFGG